MLQNFNQRLRIDALAAIAGVSTSHFYLLFKCATAAPPLIFFNRVRMHHACDLLRKRDLAIKQVAYILGYNDPFYFSRVFKTVVGVSPQAYRKRLRAPVLGNAVGPSPHESALSRELLAAVGMSPEKGSAANTLSSADRVELCPTHADLSQARCVVRSNAG